MKELFREVRSHAHDDRLLDLCGGLQSAIARLDAVLARYASADGNGLGAGAPELVDAVLGMIAIRNRLVAAFDSAPDATEPTLPARAACAESLLR